MVCPICHAPMTLDEIEDEKPDGNIIPEWVWRCMCGHAVYQTDDDFMEPD